MYFHMPIVQALLPFGRYVHFTLAIGDKMIYLAQMICSCIEIVTANCVVAFYKSFGMISA